MASITEVRELDCGDITCNLDKFLAGSGGFGDVIFGYHNGLKQEVAIKYLRSLVERRKRIDLKKYEFKLGIQTYVDLLKEKKYDEAKTTKQQLAMTIEGKARPTAKNLEQKATKLQSDGKYLEAILFLSIAADLYVKKNPDSAVATSLAGCAEKVKKIIKLLTENSDSSLKSRNTEIVRDHVIPLMRDMSQQIRNLQINEEIRCEMEVRCLSCIEVSQRYIGDLASRETTIKLGLELMEAKFENESSKYQIYGYLLSNLGVVCSKTSRIKEAIEYYTKAIEVYKTAEDLTEKERGEWIAISERRLQFNKRKLK